MCMAKVSQDVELNNEDLNAGHKTVLHLFFGNISTIIQKSLGAKHYT